MKIWRNGLIPIAILAIWCGVGGSRLQAHESATSGHAVRIRPAVYTRILGSVTEPNPMKLVGQSPTAKPHVTTVGWHHRYYGGWYGGYGPAYGWRAYRPYHGRAYGYYPGYYPGYYAPYAYAPAYYGYYAAAPAYYAPYTAFYGRRGWGGCSYW